MLFRAMDTYLHTSTAQRTMPHLNNYIGTLNTRRNMIADRAAIVPGYESRFVVLLRKILADADIPKLLKKATDLDIYLDVLIYIQKDLNQIFDATMTGVSYHNVLVARSNKTTAEFLIPAQCEDPLSELPFDQGFAAWQKIRPIRLVDIDSPELTFNLYQDQIVFKKEYPSRAVVTIDVVALVLQYINFLRVDTSGIYQPEYLHQYVIIHLLKDLEDLWLATIYNQLITSQDRFKSENIDINRIMGDDFYGYVGVEFPTAAKEILQFVDQTKNGNIYPDVFIHSLRTADSDISTYLRQLLTTTEIQNLRQYSWMEYLRDLRWLRLLYTVFNLVPDYIGTINLRRSLRRDMPILNATKFWNNCHDTTIRQYIQDDMSNWLKLLDVK